MPLVSNPMRTFAKMNRNLPRSGRFIRTVLYPFSELYGMVTDLRNRAFDKKKMRSVQFDFPVICVGNLSTGGTGKTPHVEYLIRLLSDRYHVATLSRGYKRKTKGFQLADENATAATIGDEPMQYVTKYPDTTVAVCESRLAAIPLILTLRPETNVLLLDDAFQHRSVRAGLNLLVTEYSRPFFEDHLLPLGRLRERRKGYHRADVIIVSKCPPNLSETSRQAYIRQIAPHPHQSVFFSRMDYLPAFDFFTGAPVAAGAYPQLLLVSGIARPEQLRDFLSAGCSEVKTLRFPDHHLFSKKDVAQIETTFKKWPVQKKAIIVSEKDAVRLALHRDRLQAQHIPILVQPIAVQFLTDGDIFDRKIADYVAKALPDDFQ